MEGRHEDDAETAGQLEEIFKACTVIVKPSNKHLNHDNFEVTCLNKRFTSQSEKKKKPQLDSDNQRTVQLRIMQKRF